jgi:hypothetical protein
MGMVFHQCYDLSIINYSGKRVTIADIYIKTWQLCITVKKRTLIAAIPVSISSAPGSELKTAFIS